tara:strand:- start:66 stop:602 length:537 start_codon:yes stop_codon:yes gene_type:complete
MYAFSHYEIEPDVVLLGKGLGNGVPVSAAVGRNDIFESLGYGEASDTWSANPLSSAAVLATLDEFESTDILAKGIHLSGIIEKGLIRLKETGAISKVRGEGCVWGIECADLGDREGAVVANQIIEKCYRGENNALSIHLLGALAGKVLRISPPLTMCPDECTAYLNRLYEVCQQVAAQ